MSKYNKLGNSSSQAKLPDGVRILSPQKVDLVPNKFAFNKHSSAQSTPNLDGGFTKGVKLKSPKADLLDNPQIQSYLNQGSPMRPDTAAENGKYGAGRPGPSKGSNSGARPMTVGEGYGLRQANAQKEGNGRRNEFKIKKGGNNPLVRQGTFFSNFANELDNLPETTKEDREAVEDLERWDNEFKIVTISKTLETDQKKDSNQMMQYQNDKFENYKTPFLNRDILNLIDEDEGNGANEKDGKFMSTVSNLNKQKVRVPQKSLETIMTEYNKKILNEILFQRVSKKLNTQQNKIDLDSATKSVSTDTISNFKNLQHTIQSNPRIIEYENLYQKLTAQKNPIEKVFDFEEERKKIRDAENDYASIETTLKVQFESVISDIHRKKEQLNELRLVVHNNNDESQGIEEEVDELMKRYEALEMTYNQQKEQNKTIARANNRNKKGVNKDAANRQQAYVEESSKIQRQMEDRKEQIQSLKERLEELEMDTQKSQTKLGALEREIKDLKFKKNQLRLQLKQLYLRILKNEEHIFQHEASFITIIKNMWKINEEVIEDMFPSFVDREAMAYLIENARLEYELDQLEVLTRSEGIAELQQNDPQYYEEVHHRFLKTQSSLRVPLSEQLVNVKHRLQSLKKGIVKMKRPVFIKDGGARARIIRWEELSLDADDLSEPHVDEQYIQEKISRAIGTIKAKLNDLKEKEINRIFNIYINKEIEEKNLKSLNKILLSLFGKLNAEKIYMQFVRLKQAHDFRISQNKTFVFSSTKQFSSSMLGDKTKNSFTLMLSYASNFKPVNKKSAYNLEQGENEKRKEDQKQFTKQLKDYKEIADMEINYNYNLNYNFVPELQDMDARSSFYRVKPSTANSEFGSSFKGSRRDKNLMVKTGSSFNKVTFQEPDSRPTTTQAGSMKRPSTMQMGRGFLRSAE